MSARTVVPPRRVRTVSARQVSSSISCMASYREGGTAWNAGTLRSRITTVSLPPSRMMPIGSLLKSASDAAVAASVLQVVALGRSLRSASCLICRTSSAIERPLRVAWARKCSLRSASRLRMARLAISATSDRAGRATNARRLLVERRSGAYRAGRSTGRPATPAG